MVAGMGLAAYRVQSMGDCWRSLPVASLLLAGYWWKKLEFCPCTEGLEISFIIYWN